MRLSADMGCPPATCLMASLTQPLRLQVAAWVAGTTLETALALAGTVIAAVAFVQQLWNTAEEKRAREAARERAEVAAQVAALQKVMLEASAGQRENRELTNTSMAENRAMLAADRELTNASMAENRAMLAADRRAFEESQRRSLEQISEQLKRA